MRPSSWLPFRTSKVDRRGILRDVQVRTGHFPFHGAATGTVSDFRFENAPLRHGTRTFAFFFVFEWDVLGAPGSSRGEKSHVDSARTSFVVSRERTQNQEGLRV